MDKTTGQEPRSHSNVFRIRPANPLFPAELRARLEAGVKSDTHDPTKLVDDLEDAFCAWLVGAVRLFVTKVVRGTSDLLAAKVSGG